MLTASSIFDKYSTGFFLSFKNLELIRFNLDERKNPVEYLSKINTAVDGVIALLMNEKEEL
jgi:hypothetical protein